MQTIKEIKNLFENAEEKDFSLLLNQYESDPREGVKKIIAGYYKKCEAAEKENNRLNEISKYEEEYYNKGFKLIAGIDEVGRGPLAGPVVTCAVILPRGYKLAGINDSKKLSEEKRNLLYKEIIKDAIAYEIGMVDVQTIDEINILRATLKAMQISVNNLKIKPDCLLVDAVKIPKLPVFQKAIIKGDSKSISIAAASIVAKVTRDEMMKNYHEIYPQYNFLSNKGYGSSEHIEAIKEYGLCNIHRISFTRGITAK